MTINLRLILKKQKQFSLSIFVFIDSLVVSASQDAGGYVISHQKNIELHLGCLPVDWVILHWYTCGADGRRTGVRSRDYQTFTNG